MLIEQSQTNADHVQGPFVRQAPDVSRRIIGRLMYRYSADLLELMLRAETGICETVRGASGTRRFWYRYAR